PQAPAPAPEPPPATPLPVPAVNASFVCPGYFVVTLGNSGNAPAAFEISLYMSETSREDASQVVVNPGESVHFTDFIALAGEEDSTGELTVYETVTGFTRTVTFDPSVIDCVEGSESVVLLSGSEDSECRLIDLLAMMPASSQAESTWASLGGSPLILAA